MVIGNIVTACAGQIQKPASLEVNVTARGLHSEWTMPFNCTAVDEAFEHGCAAI